MKVPFSLDSPFVPSGEGLEIPWPDELVAPDTERVVVQFGRSFDDENLAVNYDPPESASGLVHEVDSTSITVAGEFLQGQEIDIDDVLFQDGRNLYFIIKEYA